MRETQEFGGVEDGPVDGSALDGHHGKLDFGPGGRLQAFGGRSTSLDGGGG